MAQDLKTGQKISLKDGSSVVVKEKLGEGGQGAVYRVEAADGKEYALKWYTCSKLIENADFYRNLNEIIGMGAPAANFIWPLKLAVRQLGSYGYIMYLRPKGFYEFGNFFRISINPDARFRSRQAQLNAALEIVNAFRRLHLNGLAYKDINDGNFFINPRSGHVLICDNDNVTADNIEGDIGGKVRYMAAEVVEGQKPNIDTDFFSLAIILYRIFMIDHPFEGQRTLQSCLTEEKQKRMYGRDMVFCYDPDLDVNRPIKGFHSNSLYNWSHIPLEMRSLFVKALRRNAVLKPGVRVKELEWKKLLLRMRADTLVCPSKKHDIIAEPGITKCPVCGTPVTLKGVPAIRFNEFDFVITPLKNFYINDDMVIKGIGDVYEHNGVKETALRNLSGSTWVLTTPNGRTLEVKNGDLFPLRNGMHIKFDAAKNYEIIIK